MEGECDTCLYVSEFVQAYSAHVERMSSVRAKNKMPMRLPSHLMAREEGVAIVINPESSWWTEHALLLPLFARLPKSSIQ
jgi:hypothetical protein